MTLHNRVMFWLGLAAFTALLLWLLSPVLMPFAAGMVLAYLLNPLAGRLERLGMSRTLAVIVILLGFTLIVLIAAALVVPLLADQAGRLGAALPGYLERLQQLISRPGESWIGTLIGRYQSSDPEQTRQMLGNLVSQGGEWAASVASSLLAGGRAVISLIGLFVVTPVVTFYMLLDWERMIASIDAMLPVRHRHVVRRLAREIDEAIAGFFRGQGLVCIILGVFYAVGLTVAGLNFGLLIGLGAGLIGFVPYIGTVVGFFVSTGVAIAQFWPEMLPIAIVMGIFGIGQFIEGNILQPRLVGRSVGLHPVWLMFAMFAFGYLFGFVGILIAVPLAAAVGVLVRFALERYRESPLYTGAPPPPEDGV